MRKSIYLERLKSILYSTLRKGKTKRMMVREKKIPKGFRAS